MMVVVPAGVTTVRRYVCCLLSGIDSGRAVATKRRVMWQSDEGEAQTTMLWQMAVAVMAPIYYYTIQRLMRCGSTVFAVVVRDTRRALHEDGHTKMAGKKPKQNKNCTGTRSECTLGARFVSELEHRDLAKNQKLQVKSTSLLLQRNSSDYTVPSTGRVLQKYARVFMSL